MRLDALLPAPAHRSASSFCYRSLKRYGKRVPAAFTARPLLTSCHPGSPISGANSARTPKTGGQYRGFAAAWLEGGRWWRAGVRGVEQLRDEGERVDVAGSDDVEVSAVKSGQFDGAETFSQGDEARVGGTERQVRVLLD